MEPTGRQAELLVASRDVPAQEPHASLGQRLAAEMAGTFALVFVAAGADTFAIVSQGEVDVQARAVAPALIVAALIYGFSDASGAHFNPVATLAFAVKRSFPWSLVLPYWAGQLTGAIAAAAALRLLFGPVAASAGVPAPHVDPGIAVVLEFILTWLLVGHPRHRGPVQDRRTRSRPGRRRDHRRLWSDRPASQTGRP